MTTLRSLWEKNWPEIHAAITGGLPDFIFSRHPKNLDTDIPVFCYHVVEAEAFEADLDFLSRNAYVTIDADTLLKYLKGGEQAPERVVVLSFDDGARNLYEVAFPLLQAYGMTAVAFVAPRFHQEETYDSSSGSNDHLQRPLSWSQIGQMHTSGIIDFQSHTYEHRYLPRWPEPIDVLEGSDIEVIRSLRGAPLTIAEDFRLAKEILEEKLNKTVRHLAFPKYNGTPEALHIGQQCGYEAFWWGVLPRRPGNRPGQSPAYVVRVDGRYLRRLPGEKRELLGKILRSRYQGSASRFWGHLYNSGR